MGLSSLQLKMARTALGWGVRQLAANAGLAPDTITRAEQGGSDVTQKTLGALQRALEEAGIEFLPDTNSVSRREDVTTAAIRADPDMPLGVRRMYPRTLGGDTGSFEISIVRLPLPREPLNGTPPKGHDISPRHAETETAMLAACGELVQAGYGVEVKGPNIRWNHAEVMRRLNEARTADGSGTP